MTFLISCDICKNIFSHKDMHDDEICWSCFDDKCRDEDKLEGAK